MILKRGCASPTPLEYKTPEANKNVHANEARPPEERRPRGEGPRQPRREGPGMGGAGGWSWHGMLYREAMLPAPRRKEAMRIVVDHLTMPITEDDLEQLFAPYGSVERVQILADQATGQAQGLVELPEVTAAQAAMDALQGSRFKGQPLTLHAAQWQGLH